MNTQSENRRWRTVLLAFGVITFGGLLAGCEDDDALEDVGEEIDEAVDDIGDEIDREL
jgi:hypothetical protein